MSIADRVKERRMGAESAILAPPPKRKRVRREDYTEMLPPELWIQIFSNLSLDNKKTLLACSLVNRRWRALATDRSLWKHGIAKWQQDLEKVGLTPPTLDFSVGALQAV